MKLQWRLALLPCAAALAGCQGGGAQTAWALMQQQQQEQALMRQAEDQAQAGAQPSEPGLTLAMIRATQAQGRYFAALAYIDAYRQRFGANDELAALQADALRRTGQEAQSEAAYRKLLGGSQAALGWHGLGLLAGARGDYEQAARDLEHAVRLAPTDPQMLGDLGYARLRAGDSAGARVPLGQAAELDPGNARALANLALLLLVEGKAAQAQQLMERAKLGPEARSQVFELASQISARRDDAPRSGVVRPVAQVSSGRDVVMPMLQPTMDRMLNPPLSQ